MLLNIAMIVLLLWVVANTNWNRYVLLLQTATIVVVLR